MTASRIRKAAVLAAAISAAAASSPAETPGVALVEDGAAACRVVVAADAHPALKFGAKEMAKYLSAATGAKVEVNGGDDGLLPVVVRLAGAADGKDVMEDGFAVVASPRKVEIAGGSPRGALYGCYDILKKHAGMRWITPGDDGEYCVLTGRTVRVPPGRRVANPYLKVRGTTADGEDAWLWHARNFMAGKTSRNRYEDPKTGQPTALAPRLEELCVDGSATAGNSHIMTDMMTCWAGRDTRARIDALYAEHPEFFPLVDGSRRPIYGAGAPNPCVSNPELLDLMAENLLRFARGPHGSQAPVVIGNNDTTAWCSCDKCLALDAPELAGTKGRRADRYWHAVAGIAGRVWAKDPSIKLGGWAYQDFWLPPARVKVDPRLMVVVSYNNQCWRHSVDDPSCPANARWREILGAWRRTGVPLVVNRDEIGCVGTPGSSYAPVEDVLRANFLAYPKYGCSGSKFCVYAPFQHRSIFQKAPYFGKADRWHGIWQTCYMSARMMWNPEEVDFDAELEEACRLYYGEAAWKAGMKEFRALQKKTWRETPGCYGLGQRSKLGSCLDGEGVEERLVALMDRAVAAAEASGDKRAAAHMRREKDVFELTWLAERRRLVESRNKPKAARPRRGKRPPAQ